LISGYNYQQKVYLFFGERRSPKTVGGKWWVVGGRTVMGNEFVEFVGFVEFVELKT
jgi:hypothetical protein